MLSLLYFSAAIFILIRDLTNTVYHAGYSNMGRGHNGPRVRTLLTAGLKAVVSNFATFDR